VCDAWKCHETNKQEHQEQQEEEQIKITIDNIEEEEELRGDENV
jgi:hypothetical protein